MHDVHPAARMSEPFLIKETAKLSDIIEITDFEDPKLDVYARTKEIQLLNRANPEDGIFIAESPKVVERALDAGSRFLFWWKRNTSKEKQNRS